jgi:hypothetical protein
MTQCRWCIEPHDEATCQRIKNLKTLAAFGIVEPTGTADDLNDAVAARMMTYRTALKAHLGYAAEHGFTFPEIIRKTDPDHITDP